MTLLQWAERHVDTAGRIWQIYDTPTLPIPAPEGCRWIQFNQDVPKFRDRSEYMIQKELNRRLVEEAKEKQKRKREEDEYHRNRIRREQELIKREELDHELAESKRIDIIRNTPKTRLTCVEASRAVMVACRLKDSGWTRLRVGTWTNDSKGNLFKIVFKNHENNQHKFFIEAHFRKNDYELQNHQRAPKARRRAS